MKKMLKTIMCLTFLLLISSCNRFSRILCGDLDNEAKKMISTVHGKYGEFVEVETIPCEFYHANLIWKKPELDRLMINKIHNELYDDVKKKGWIGLDVYIDGNLIYRNTVPKPSSKLQDMPQLPLE